MGLQQHRTSRARIDQQCSAVQGRGGSTGEQGLRVQGCLTLSLKQVSYRPARVGNRQRERDRGGCLSVFKFEGKLRDLKCAGAVSAVFRGESTR